jgi:hypothetical protein
MNPEMFHSVAEHIQSHIEREVARLQSDLAEDRRRRQPKPIEQLKRDCARKLLNDLGMPQNKSRMKIVAEALEAFRGESNRPQKSFISVGFTFKPNPQFAQQLTEQLMQREDDLHRTPQAGDYVGHVL